ncbi:MAG: hypothetical protein AAFV53_40150 [Myxococcota bacterium]
MSDTQNDRLHQIQEELASILEERLTALSQLMQTTEATTRRIISADIELERHRLNQERFEAERAQLEGTIDGTRARAEEARKQHGALLAEKEQLEKEVEKRERETRELDTEVERNRERIGSLEAEAVTLREENSNLRTKVKTLEENIVRMQRLKEELMSSVTGLAQQLRQASGTE